MLGLLLLAAILANSLSALVYNPIKLNPGLDVLVIPSNLLAVAIIQTPNHP